MRGRSVVLAIVTAAILLWPLGGQGAAASAGSVDHGFGVGGAVQTDLSRVDSGRDVLVQPDGKAVTIGATETASVLLRHRVDGSLDPAFGTGGVAQGLPQPAPLEAGAMQGDGRIIAVGSNFASDEVVVLRYLASGALDAGFGTGGRVLTDFGNGDDGRAVALQPDGKIVVGGRSGAAAIVARYLPNGHLDPSFGTGGRVVTTFGAAGTGAEVEAVGILSTGAVVVGGRVFSDAGGSSMLLARYTAGGVLDGAFGSAGRVAAGDERLASVSSLVVQAGDRIVVAGEVGPGTALVQGLARYQAGGSLDPTFGVGGVTSRPLGATSTTADITLDATGRLVTAGSARASQEDEGSFSFVFAARFSPDGVADAAFGCAGSTQIELSASGGGRGNGVAIAPDGRILVAGTAFVGPNSSPNALDFLLVRILAQGAPGAGYWVTRADGGTTPFGTADGCGSLRGLTLAQPVVGHAARPSADGYWFVAADGGVFTRGDAPFLGSAAGIPLARPVVGMARTPSGQGYWLVASDGGIFSYGDADFFGSTGGLRLHQPVVAMAATPTGQGYWLVASDGGIFTFGDAGFLGSTGELRLDQPVVGMAARPTGDGYWLVARDGGIFAFGGAPFLGSTGGVPLDSPVVGMARTPTGDGYWLAGADGGIFSFGGAPFLGSTARQPFTSPAVAVTPSS